MGKSKRNKEVDTSVQEFTDAISDKNWVLGLNILETKETQHAHTAPTKYKNGVISAISNIFDDRSRLEIAKFLSKSSNDTAKEIGITLLPQFYPKEKQFIEGQIAVLGNDKNWEVREWVASGLAEIICLYFLEAESMIHTLAKSDISNLRRLIAVAIGYSAKCTNETEFRDLIKLFNPLLEDTDQYVKKNLGPFAIGSYALSYKTTITTDWLLEVLITANDTTLWNLGMVLTTAIGAQYFRDLYQVFSKLLHHMDNKSLNSVVKKIIKNLQKRNPEELKVLLNNLDTKERAIVSDLIN